MNDTAAAASALLAANRRRRRIRRWIAVGTLPLALAALLVVGKILSMYAFAHQAITSYVIDDYAGAESSARGQGILNWFEPYKAPFNTGTALAASEELPEARAQLEEALRLARGLEVCGVRVNLALVVERMGDAARTAGDGPGAAALYGESLAITVETPPECRSDEAREQSSDTERDMGKSLDDLQDRLQQKQRPPQEEQGQQPEQQEERPEPSPQSLEELRERLEQGTRERDQRNGGDDQSGTGTERPW